MDKTSNSCEPLLAEKMGCEQEEVKQVMKSIQEDFMSDDLMAILLQCEDKFLFGLGIKRMYNQYGSMIINIIKRNSATHEQAEDIMMFSFDALIDSSRKQGFKIQHNIKGWLLTVAFNRWKRINKKKAYSMKVSLSQQEETIISSYKDNLDLEASLIEQEQKALMYQAIDELPEKARLALLMDLADKPRKEIQAELGHKSIGVTNNLISQAKKDLLKKFKS